MFIYTQKYYKEFHQKSVFNLQIPTNLGLDWTVLVKGAFPKQAFSKTFNYVIHRCVSQVRTIKFVPYLIPAWFYGHSILLIAPASQPQRPVLDKQGIKK